jgi:hypothetical protein
MTGVFTKKQTRELGNAIVSTFAVVDDRVRREAIIARETGRAAPPSAVQIQERCRVGLQAIFGVTPG